MSWCGTFYSLYTLYIEDSWSLPPHIVKIHQLITLGSIWYFISLATDYISVSFLNSKASMDTNWLQAFGFCVKAMLEYKPKQFSSWIWPKLPTRRKEPGNQSIFTRTCLYNRNRPPYQPFLAGGGGSGFNVLKYVLGTWISPPFDALRAQPDQCWDRLCTCCFSCINYVWCFYNRNCCLGYNRWLYSVWWWVEGAALTF